MVSPERSFVGSLAGCLKSWLIPRLFHRNHHKTLAAAAEEPRDGRTRKLAWKKAMGHDEIGGRVRVKVVG